MRLTSSVHSMRLLLQTLCFALTSSQLEEDAARSSFKHVCYLRTPENNSASLQFEGVDVELCSHIIMGFATVSSDSTINLSDVGGPEGLTAFTSLRQRRPDIKLMFSVGGGGGGENFQSMVSSVSTRCRFIASARKLLDAASLDGLDLDWEFPSMCDAQHFFQLLKDMSKEFRKKGERQLLLSVAVPAPSLLVVGRYYVRRMARFVDFVNLMTYDLHLYSWYTPWVNHNSPLFTRCSEPLYLQTLNVKNSVELWANLGMPKSKIMVGIPTYGLAWVLKDPDSWEVGALATGRQERGDGFVYYPEVCRLLEDGASCEYDEEAKVPFLHNGTLWISYDDQDSVAIKAEWAVRNGYGGTMTFTLNADDWAGICGNKPFPLHRSIIKHPK